MEECNPFQDLIDSAVTRPDQIKISEISPLENFEASTERYLRSFLDSKIPNLTFMAVLLNAVLSQSKGTFLFSRTIFESLLTKANELQIVERSTMSGTDFKEFMTWTRRNRYLDVVVQGTKRGEASIVEVTHPAVRDLLLKKVSEDFLATQKETCRRLHRSDKNSGSDFQSNLPVASSSEMTEVNERVNIDVCIKDTSEDRRLSEYPLGIEKPKQPERPPVYGFRRKKTEPPASETSSANERSNTATEIPKAPPPVAQPPSPKVMSAEEELGLLLKSSGVKVKP